MVLRDGTALPYDADTQLITYQGVVEIPGTTKEQLYNRARDWLLKTASTTRTYAPQGISTDQLISRGRWPSTFMSFPVGFVQYTISIYLKEGRYKYVISNLSHGDGSATEGGLATGPLEQPDAPLTIMGSKRQWDKIRKQADTDAKKLAADLQVAMRDPKNPGDF